MKWFTSLLLFFAFIGFANSSVAQDCPNCLQAPTEVFSQNLLVVKRPVRNAVANARYGISNRVGNGCTGRSVRTVMAVPVVSVSLEMSFSIKAATSSAVSDLRLMRCFCILSITSAALFTFFSPPFIIRFPCRAVIRTSSC